MAKNITVYLVKYGELSDKAHEYLVDNEYIKGNDTVLELRSHGSEDKFIFDELISFGWDQKTPVYYHVSW